MFGMTSNCKLCPVSQIADTKELQKLDKIRRKALTQCLDIPTTAGIEAIYFISAKYNINVQLLKNRD